MSYKGKYKPSKKYRGDPSNVVYRSWWEYKVMKWLDSNDSVVCWSSEECVIPYLCETDGQWHRYFIDFAIWYDNGKRHLIEIKPKVQTIEPKPRKRKTRKYINEALTYTKNRSKWTYAKQWAENNGWEFWVWTEETLRKIGIKIDDANRTKKLR